MSNIENIVAAYRESFALNGDSPSAVLCPKGRQNIRFDVLTSEIKSDRFTILDFGCGLGHFYEYLQDRFPLCDYHGVDIVPEFIDAARSKFGDRARFEFASDTYEPVQLYDYVFVSGTFNLKYLNVEPDNTDYILGRIKSLFGKTRHIMTCDFMSTNVDFRQPDAFHMDPAFLTSHVSRSLTRRFKLRHDYMPYEFAVILYQEDAILRPDNVFTVERTQ
ncbi:MAG: class I SAM-dependent methyltransferase [Hyphomicrobiaceae bacterium]